MDADLRAAVDPVRLEQRLPRVADDLSVLGPTGTREHLLLHPVARPTQLLVTLLQCLLRLERAMGHRDAGHIDAGANQFLQDRA